MAMVILETIDARGEELAEQAADALGVAAGADPDFDSVTLDSEEHETDEALAEDVVNALDDLDADWRSHLSIAE
jgi:hypothetical protein